MSKHLNYNWNIQPLSRNTLKHIYIQISSKNHLFANNSTTCSLRNSNWFSFFYTKKRKTRKIKKFSVKWNNNKKKTSFKKKALGCHRSNQNPYINPVLSEVAGGFRYQLSFSIQVTRRSTRPTLAQKEVHSLHFVCQFHFIHLHHHHQRRVLEIYYYTRFHN